MSGAEDCTKYSWMRQSRPVVSNTALPVGGPVPSRAPRAARPVSCTYSSMEATRRGSLVELVKQRPHDLLGHAGVVEGIVLVAAVDTEPRRKLVEATAGRRPVAINTPHHVRAGPGIDHMGQFQRVEPQPGRHRETQRLGGCVQHQIVVAEAVVSNHRAAIDPPEELAERVFQTRSVCELTELDSGQLGDPLWKPALWPDQRVEVVDDVTAGYQHGPDLDDLVLGGLRPVGVRLQVEDHILR